MRCERALAICILLCSAATAAEPAATPTGSEIEPTLTIRIYDYAGLSPRTLERARRQAALLLERSGIRPRWERCRTSEEQGPSDLSCRQRVGPHVIQVRIHSREMAKKITRRGVEFGYAVQPDSGFGIIAGVFAQRTAETARSLGVADDTVLGHMIAHEVGHLLLGMNQHSVSGLMKPRWTKRDILRSKTGAIEFTADEGRHMQRQVTARLALL